jgi:hypothetical protein
MKFFQGVVEQPKPIELLLAAIMIGLIALIFFMLDGIGFSVWPSSMIIFSAMVTAIIGAVYSISIRKGWSILLLLTISVVSFACTSLVY